MMRARKRIEKALSRATPEDRHFGRIAYWSYHNAMRNFARFYGAGFVQTVEAFVALSPNNSYHPNLRSLSAVLFAYASGRSIEDFTVSTFNFCKRNAFGYVSGELSFLDTVGGPKISSFRDNILYPDTSTKVTVDGHMICVWSGEDMTMREANLFLRSMKRYREMERDFHLTARKYKMPTTHLQATLWALRKREGKILYSDQRDLFTGESRWSEVADPIDYPPFQKEDWLKWTANKGSQKCSKS